MKDDALQKDLQAGLIPVLNNLRQFAPAIGLAAVAVATLAKNWDQVEAFIKAKVAEASQLSPNDLKK